ncbi:hypothetical protein HUT19_05440 [Streptomyces sp. NA02950]|uniref:hypothetical protein n=1 Tax=Streptomyces sp. NA02950 TaxID=2742137 RepID=UPI0015906807|nr:hypothetical protein [Streptomyces sp. NA02950]QKV91252.1 hypothetical protein HUT19_05440 [Streptomyces sp. NA02950]
MSDVYELTLAMDLCDDLSEEEIAELRWHLGLGPQPERLSILSSFPVVVADESGEPQVEDQPEALLSQHGAAWRVGGVVSSELIRRKGRGGRRGWAMTSRQELHPDLFGPVGVLLTWLAGKADPMHADEDGAVHVGCLRFLEDLDPRPLVVRNGTVGWPE